MGGGCCLPRGEFGRSGPARGARVAERRRRWPGGATPKKRFSPRSCRPESYPRPFPRVERLKFKLLTHYSAPYSRVIFRLSRHIAGHLIVQLIDIRRFLSLLNHFFLKDRRVDPKVYGQLGAGGKFSSRKWELSIFPIFCKLERQTWGLKVL